MTETLISPGVLAKETDTSFITKGPVVVGAAIVGPTAKGPVNVPTVVTTYSEFESVFGRTVTSGSNNFTFFTSISAQNYFQQGGNSLLVTRVAEGDYSPAISSVSSITGGTPVFEIQTISEGAVMNSSGSETSSGILENGTKENIRWEISYSDTGSGTFNLLIRRGDDNTKNKIILEQWRGLDLDPDSENYIERVIGNTINIYNEDPTTGESYITPMGTYTNKSAYVVVKNVQSIPNYFLADGTPDPNYSGLLPKVSSGSFSEGSGSMFDGMTANFYEKINGLNTQGLIVSQSSVPAYDEALSLLNSKEDYSFNVITTPGLTMGQHGNTLQKVINIADGRQDCIAVIDLVGFGSTINTVVEKAKSMDTSYAATYWPWVQTSDGGKAVWVPASTMIPGVYAFTDASSEPWFAPAGMLRGGLGRVIQPERKITSGHRDTLYTNNVNPIAYLPQNGIAVFGQKTTQKRSSALGRINVRRLLIEVKGYISQISNSLVFEPNTQAVRNNFLSRVNPYLETIQQRNGLYAFKVVMDDSNNDAASIDRNELRGQIFLQPTKTIEYILLDFSITPTGASFE